MAGPTNKSSPCRACNFDVKENDCALYCEGFCEKWFHIGCVKVCDMNYRNIQVLCDEVVWYCSECRVRVASLIERARAQDPAACKSNSIDQESDSNSFSILFDEIERLSKNYEALSYRLESVELKNVVCQHVSDSTCSDKTRSDNPKISDKLTVCKTNSINSSRQSVNLSKSPDLNHVDVTGSTDSANSISPNLKSTDKNRSTKRKKSIVNIDIADYSTNRLSDQVDFDTSAVEVNCISTPAVPVNNEISNVTNTWSTVLRRKPRKPKNTIPANSVQPATGAKLVGDVNTATVIKKSTDDNTCALLQESLIFYRTELCKKIIGNNANKFECQECALMMEEKPQKPKKINWKYNPKLKQDQIFEGEFESIKKNKCGKPEASNNDSENLMKVTKMMKKMKYLKEVSEVDQTIKEIPDEVLIKELHKRFGVQVL